MVLKSSLPLVALLAALGCSATSAGPGAKSAEAAKPAESSTTVGPAKSCEGFLKAVCDGRVESSLCDKAKEVAALMSDEACAVASRDVAITRQRLALAQRSCEELTGRLCQHFGAQSELCALVTAQTAQFDAERCDMMLSRYDAVLADLEKMQERLKPVAPEKFAKLLEGNGPAFGPADAKVQLVLFSDFQCPYCQRAMGTVDAVRKQYGDRVRFVFRQFPLSFHEHAQDAARAALFAHSRGKFWEMHDKLFANQRELDRESLERYAKELGLDSAALREALEGEGFKAAVAADVELGTQVSVEGTPSLFIDGKRVGNATDAEEVLRLVEEELKGVE
jgi:protein-disulfide isomerase